MPNSSNWQNCSERVSPLLSSHIRVKYFFDYSGYFRNCETFPHFVPHFWFERVPTLVFLALGNFCCKTYFTKGSRFVFLALCNFCCEIFISQKGSRFGFMVSRENKAKKPFQAQRVLTSGFFGTVKLRIYSFENP